MSEYLERQQRKFEDYAETYRRETNEIFRELVKQLILVATVFLSISSFVFTKADIFLKSTTFDKHLLTFTWILLGASLVFGIIQFFIDYFYFREWTESKFSVVESIVAGETTEENLHKIVLKNQKGIPSESSTIFVYLQSASLVSAVLLLIILMIKTLFLI